MSTTHTKAIFRRVFMGKQTQSEFVECEFHKSMKDVDFTGSEFEKCMFYGLTFTRVDFTDCRFIECVFEACTFDDCTVFDCAFVYTPHHAICKRGTDFSSVVIVARD